MITKDYTTKDEKVCELFKKRLKRHPIHTQYGADADGNVYSFKSNIFLKYGITYNGYCDLNLRLDNKRKHIKAHKFVYECFNGLVNTSTNSGESLTIDHIDNNKLNNCINNLRIITHRQNVNKNRLKTSRFTGVYLNIKRNKYISYFRGKYLGTFNNETYLAFLFDNEYEKIHGIRPNNTEKGTF